MDRYDAIMWEHVEKIMDEKTVLGLYTDVSKIAEDYVNYHSEIKRLENESKSLDFPKQVEYAKQAIDEQWLKDKKALEKV